MRNKEVEKRLTQAISNSVPDVLDDILIKCEKKKGFEKKMVKKVENKKIKFMSPRLVGALAMAMVFALSLFGIYQYDNVYKVYSTIEFDVNPSVEIEVNKKEEIIKVYALNDDGQEVLDDMDLEGVDLDVAVNAIIGSMLKKGYLSIDQNSILVSVKNDDAEKREKLQNEISEEINILLKASSIEGAILTQSYEIDDAVKKISQENNISEGKAELINRILKAELKDAKGNIYTSESLSKLSINELKLLLEEKNAILENVQSSGNASSNSYIGKDKAKVLSFEKAGVKESDVYDLEVELDCDDGLLVYEVEFKSSNKEYEYEIEAKTGNFVYSEVDSNDDINSNTTNNKNNSSSSDKVSSSSTTKYIGKEKAKSIAFSNAGVSSGEVKNLSVEFDYDDGVYHYEVEFKFNNKEYTYDINAVDGEILDKEIDIDD